MNNKYIGSILMAIFGFILILSAASYAASEEAHVSLDKIVGKMSIYLLLTDEQTRQIKPIMAEDMAKRSGIIKNDKNDRETLKKALDDLRLSTNKKLSQYLTEEQMKKLEEMQKAQQEQKTERKGGMGGRGGMGGGKMFNRGAF